MKIRITKPEFDLISQLLNEEIEFFTASQINDSEMVLSFKNVEKATEFDAIIKEKLVYQGFDIDYNPNQFGLMCENVIDKMYTLLK